MKRTITQQPSYRPSSLRSTRCPCTRNLIGWRRASTRYEFSPPAPLHCVLRRRRNDTLLVVRVASVEHKALRHVSPMTHVGCRNEHTWLQLGVWPGIREPDVEWERRHGRVPADELLVGLFRQRDRRLPPMLGRSCAVGGREDVEGRPGCLRLSGNYGSPCNRRRRRGVCSVNAR